MSSELPVHSSSTASSGARLVDTEGRTLPLRKTHLAVFAGGGLARVSLSQRFVNPYEEPLRVRYLLPLPSDAAVAGFSFTVDGARTVGVVKPREEARAEFERALLEGKTAALLEEERSSLFTEEVGNIPPGALLEVEVSLDQPLAWRAEGAWSWRFPTVVGPRYLGEPGRTPDAARIEVPIAERFEVDARATLELRIDDALTGPAQSPNHTLRSVGEGTLGFEQAGGVPLDRDLVVEWPVAGLEPGARVVLGRPPEGHAEASSAFALLTLVPPKIPGPGVPRDLIYLIDVSGSMHGEPLDQAKRVLLALLDRLGERDTLQMIAFADRPKRWKRAPARMTDERKREASAWIRGLVSAGATEMRSGIEAALDTLREGALRQVVLVTDGYVGFEPEIVGAARDGLPKACRIHTLGVGHGVNRSLTSPLARVGGGTELIVAPGEDAEKHATRLLAATGGPQVTEVEVSGSAMVEAAQSVMPDLYAGMPARIPLRIRPEGGTVTVEGRSEGGPWSTTLEVSKLSFGAGPMTPVTAFARERVEDLEAARAAAGADVAALDQGIEGLGVRFQIATRRTSWVAVRPDATVDPTAPLRSEVMPHALVAGVSPHGIGLARAGSPRSFGASPPAAPARAQASFFSAASAAPLSAPAGPTPSFDLGFRRLFGSGRGRASLRRRSVADESFLPEPADEALGLLLETEEALREERSDAPELPPRSAPPTGKGPAEERPSPPPGEPFRERSAKEAARKAWAEKRPSSPPGEPSRRPSSAKGPRLVARVRLVRPGQVIFELEAEVAFPWVLPEEVTVRFGDGDGREVRVDRRASTASCASVAPGQRVRLVLVLDDVPVLIEVGDLVADVAPGDG